MYYITYVMIIFEDLFGLYVNYKIYPCMFNVEHIGIINYIDIIIIIIYNYILLHLLLNITL